MDLPNLFTASTEGSSKLIICIVLSDASVQSLLLSISLQGTKIVKKSSIVPYTDQANCILKTDETLQELGKESEKVNEVLFGLEQAWLSGNAIIDAKKSLLHAVTNDLSLKPLGFVVQTEALYQHYVSHNAHASIILLVFSEQFVSVVIVAQGQLKLTETVGRSQDIVADIKEALARYSAKYESTYLPAKFVCASLVLSETELSQYQQTLLDVTWGEEIPFVQQPTVDVMRSELAISLIAQQAGQAIAASLNNLNMSPPVSSKREVPTISSSEDLGFKQVVKEELKKEIALDDSVKSTATSFGIPIKSDLLQTKTVHAMDEGADEDDEVFEKPSLWKKMLGQQNVSIGGPHKRQFNLRTMIIIGVSTGLLALLIVASLFVFFFSQVTAVIVPKPVTVTKEVKLTIDPEAQASDPQNLIIPGVSVSKTISKESTIQTTGIKIVGDKAKGEVIIYNKTQSDKNFAAGTVVAIDKLQFLTDEAITVPAAVVTERGQSETSIKSGEKKTTVTAYLIGVEGNIEKEKVMSVADFDQNTYSAVSVNAFTGGSSREVRVVAQADIDAAIKTAQKSVLEQANMEFAQDSKNGVSILPTSTIKVTSTKHSAELEKEAEDLVTTITAEVVALSYKVEDLKPLATQILTSEVPQGYEIASEDPQILSAPEDSINSTGEVALNANISSTAMPKLDENALKQDIAGKPVEEALSVLKSKTGVQSASFIFYPSWAQGLVGKVPSKLERITIEKIEK